MSQSINKINSLINEKNRDERIESLAQILDKEDLVKEIMTSDLDDDQKIAYLEKVDEWYMTASERAIAAIKRKKAEEAKKAREEKIQKLGHAAKTAVSKAAKGKDVVLRSGGFLGGSILKGIIDPLKKGWDRA